MWCEFLKCDFITNKIIMSYEIFLSRIIPGCSKKKQPRKQEFLGTLGFRYKQVGSTYIHVTTVRYLN
jgi:hypothetical protein